MLRRRLGAALGLAGLAFVLISTLTPVSDPRHLAQITPLLCLVCGDQGGADVAVNLLLFIPLALGLGLQGTLAQRTVLLCFLLSFAVECIQFFLIPGRDASLSDVLTNTTGAAIGAALGATATVWATPTPSQARRLVIAGLAVWLGVLACWAWVLTPLMPDGRIMSRWAHEAPGRDVFDGRVLSVELNGLAMPPNGAPPDSAALRSRIDSGAFQLDAVVRSGQPRPDRLWIYMFRVPSGPALTLSQAREEAAVAIPTRGLRLRLHPTLVTLDDAFPDTAGVRVRLSASQASRRVRLATSYEGRERSVVLALSPAFGWIQFVPMQLATGTRVRWVTGAVLAVFLVPVGYWGARCAAPRRSAGLLFLGLALGLAALPVAAGFPPVHWSEWLGGALGILAGGLLQWPAGAVQARRSSPAHPPAV